MNIAGDSLNGAAKVEKGRHEIWRTANERESKCLDREISGLRGQVVPMLERMRVGWFMDDPGRLRLTAKEAFRQMRRAGLFGVECGFDDGVGEVLRAFKAAKDARNERR